VPDWQTANRAFSNYPRLPDDAYAPPSGIGPQERRRRLAARTCNCKPVRHVTGFSRPLRLPRHRPPLPPPRPRCPVRLFDEAGIIALDHHSNDRLRARGAQHDASAAFELALDCSRRRDDAGLGHGIEASGHAHVQENLRISTHGRRQFGEAGAGGFHHREHLQGAHQTIARGGFVQTQYVSGGSPPRDPPASFNIASTYRSPTCARRNSMSRSRAHAPTRDCSSRCRQRDRAARRPDDAPSPR